MKQSAYSLLFAMTFCGYCTTRVYTVPDFSFFCDGLTGAQDIQMVNGSNLMSRNPATFTDSVVSTDGYWNMGFLNEGDMVGWAKNSWKTYAGYEGWMSGRYYGNLGAGNHPDEIYLIHDVLGDGIGLYDSGTGTWYLGDDDVFYAYDFEGGIWDASQNILINGLRGDLTVLPVYELSGNPLTLPLMTIYLRSSNLVTFANLASHWLNSDADQANNWHNGADNDHNGGVDFDDLMDVIMTWLSPD